MEIEAMPDGWEQIIKIPPQGVGLMSTGEVEEVANQGQAFIFG